MEHTYEELSNSLVEVIDKLPSGKKHFVAIVGSPGINIFSFPFPPISYFSGG
jgi:hypothetical protein